MPERYSLISTATGQPVGPTGIYTRAHVRELVKASGGAFRSNEFEKRIERYEKGHPGRTHREARGHGPPKLRIQGPRPPKRPPPLPPPGGPIAIDNPTITTLRAALRRIPGNPMVRLVIASYWARTSPRVETRQEGRYFGYKTVPRHGRMPLSDAQDIAREHHGIGSFVESFRPDIKDDSGHYGRVTRIEIEVYR